MGSPPAPRATTAAGTQLSWHAGGLVAWSPAEAFGRRQQGAASSWRAPDGDVQVIRVQLPGGPSPVLARRLAPAAVAALPELELLDGPGSPSVEWACAVHAAATGLVDRGRAVAALSHGGHGRWTAGWQPLPGDLDKLATAFAPAMPPAVAAAAPVEADRVPALLLTLFVDAVARRRLARRGWLPELGDVRQPGGRAARLISRALLAEHGMFRADAALVEHLVELAAALDEVRWRADGQLIARARLRLGLPDEDGTWPLGFELVADDDPGSWCPAAEVLGGTPAGMAFAGGEEQLRRAQATAEAARGALADTAPWLHDWLDEPEVGVDVEAAAATLGVLDRLSAAGIELLAPDALVRRRPAARGTAHPGDANASRFTAGALVHWSAVIDGTAVDERALARAARAGGELVEIGGRWVLIDGADARRALATIERHRRDDGELTPVELLRLAARLKATADQLSDEAAATLTAGGWLGELVGGLPDARLEEADEPPGFAAALRPYQRRGLGWLRFLEQTGFGGCLADDMGLGKTPTTLAHLAGRPGPHLVVCPLSVVHNWEAEAARFVPLTRVVVHHGVRRPDAATFAEVTAANDIVLSTYATVTRDVDVLATVNWTTVVLDEAQAIKNPNTQTARAVRRLPALQRLALTGTPVENRLSELWSIMAFAVPGLLGSLSQFRTNYATPIERRADAGAAQALRSMTAPFLLRRTKADRALVPDLPDKVEQIAWSALTREQAVMYQSVVDRLLHDADAASGMHRRGLVLAALTRLKQICNHPAHALGDGSALPGRSGKLSRFDELVAQLVEAGERALVFTQFRAMGGLLERHLDGHFGGPVPFLHGSVSKTGRQAMVERFQSGEGPPLLLVSLKAGGTGLNLTAASRVLHYDRWWNPAVEDQATDRAWRIGQQRSVFVHKLVCQGTIEERVDTLISDKRAIADAVVGATGEAWLSELSTDELRDLVVLDRGVLR